jgi:hypothetical protein
VLYDNGGDQSYITYFSSEKDYQNGRAGKGKVDLDGASVLEGKQDSEKSEYRFKINVAKPVSRAYEFIAQTRVEQEDWVVDVRRILQRKQSREAELRQPVRQPLPPAMALPQSPAPTMKIRPLPTAPAAAVRALPAASHAHAGGGLSSSRDGNSGGGSTRGASAPAASHGSRKVDAAANTPTAPPAAALAAGALQMYASKDEIAARNSTIPTIQRSLKLSSSQRGGASASKAEATAAHAAATVGSGLNEDRPWLFGAMSRTEAEALLVKQPVNCFLFRPSKTKGSYALSLRWNGKCAHHLIAPVSEFKLSFNNHITMCASLIDVVQMIKQPCGPPINWKCPLWHYVDKDTKQTVDGSAPETDTVYSVYAPGMNSTLPDNVDEGAADGADEPPPVDALSKPKPGAQKGPSTPPLQPERDARHARTRARLKSSLSVKQAGTSSRSNSTRGVDGGEEDASPPPRPPHLASTSTKPLPKPTPTPTSNHNPISTPTEADNNTPPPIATRDTAEAFATPRQDGESGGDSDDELPPDPNAAGAGSARSSRSGSGGGAGAADGSTAPPIPGGRKPAATTNESNLAHTTTPTPTVAASTPTATTTFAAATKEAEMGMYVALAAREQFVAIGA